MKATDFRIGNLILKNNEIYEISSLFFVDLHDGTIRENYNNNYVIKPIPITEEWLLKFGFIKKYWKAKNTHYFELEKIEILLEDTFYKKGVTYYKSNLLFEYYPKHVHHLQNLYFALTGTELIIKDLK